MVFNTATVGSAVTPVVVQAFLSHYLNRKPRAQKPTAHISYDEGLQLIRQFLLYASHHTVEDIQRFTSQWVPHPRWVKADEVKIPEEYISKSAEAIQEQLGHHGISRVGGKTWWQWRRLGSTLNAEWIEMRADYQRRKRTNDSGKRVMLYVHGGAYFFGSVDEHRYQMQRHARKLQAKVFAPRYRLAPQFPFPCGLHDCLAAYLYLLTVQDPSTIILAGDSAGGGMVLSMLVTLRDQGLPLPAGAILISPWVDLTHSFPSVSGNNPLDYIPPFGFHHRPSAAWPPPNSDDMLAAEEDVRKMALGHPSTLRQQNEQDAVRGYHVHHNVDTENVNKEAVLETETGGAPRRTPNTMPRDGNLSIMVDGNLVEVKDQIQMYATNQLMTHPLVSPALQPSLGGLPPLLIMVGGGEMLRDEQIYLAHKASNPPKYPPSDAILDEYPQDNARDKVNRWKPTDVQLQVWEDLCHVAPTLSFTRPAKHMYRSIAQFGAWALARAQETEIEIMDDDDVSVISRSESDDENDAIGDKKKMSDSPGVQPQHGQIGQAGDPLPHFKDHMIRQSVDRHGVTYPLEPESQFPGCNMPPNQIGVIDEGLLKKWMARKREWDTKFASTKRKVQKQRAKEMARGYKEFGDGEIPPPSALAGRRRRGEDMMEGKKKRSTGMSLWALWGSKHDEKTIEAEQEADKAPESTPVLSKDGADASGGHGTSNEKGKNTDRSRSRRRFVKDEHQTKDDVDENTPAADLLAIRKDKSNAGGSTPGAAASPSLQVPSINGPDNGDDFDRKRPKAGGIAFPFSLAGHDATASMTTLTSSVGVRPGEDVVSASAKEDGLRGRDSHPAAAENPKSEDEKVIADGKAMDRKMERPPLETFVTAVDVLPTGEQS